MPRGFTWRWLCLVCALSACRAPGDRALPGHEAGQDSLPAAAGVHQDETAPVSPASPAVAAEPVHLRTGPGESPFDVSLRTRDADPGLSRTYGRKVLATALREAVLGTYPCTSCHRGRGILERERVADAHRNIEPVHPAETGAACGTCHDARNVERLVLQNGETATLDQAYRLCAQCHFRQVDAWAGGGHGKRLDGWRGPRVIMNCADCHDPHRPGIEKRIPFPGPRLTRSH